MKPWEKYKTLNRLRSKYRNYEKYEKKIKEYQFIFDYLKI